MFHSVQGKMKIIFGFIKFGREKKTDFFFCFLKKHFNCDKKKKKKKHFNIKRKNVLVHSVATALPTM